LIAAGQTVAAIEKSLLARLANLEKWSNYGDHPDSDKLEKENDLFKKELLRFTRQPATLSACFPAIEKRIAES
jgi:hypothetical protein